MDIDDGHELVPHSVETTLCQDPNIDFVVAFGSQATGESRSSSDLDVAVKFSDELDTEERFRKRCRLSGRLQSSDTPFVDISDIEELSLEFAYEAVTGVFVCGDEAIYNAFADEIEAAFEVEQDDLERRQRELISRIASDGLHG